MEDNQAAPSRCSAFILLGDRCTMHDGRCHVRLSIHSRVEGLGKAYSGSGSAASFFLVSDGAVGAGWAAEDARLCWRSEK